MEEPSKLTRQERVLEWIKEFTQDTLVRSSGAPAGVDATAIADALHLDRANVSKELNLLYRAGQLVKLQGKPTRFLHRELLAQHYPGCFFPTTVPRGSSLADYLTQQVTTTAPNRVGTTELETTIGAHGSLQTAVEQAKAAVCYPPRGLHTLLFGGVGVGKIRFARMMYDFARTSGKLAEDAPFITFNCQDYSSSPQLMMAQLFGQGKGTVPGVEKGRRGLVEQAADGILYLDGIQKLPLKVQELLATLMEKNTFNRMGEASVTRYGDLMIIAASIDPPDAPTIAHMAGSIPMLISLPDLDCRGPEEVLEHLVLFFSREATATGISFRIHKDILACLTEAPCPGQIGEMKSRVKIVCSLAYLEYSSGTASSGTIEIGYRHLPASVTRALSGSGERRAAVAELFSHFQQETMLFTPGEAPALPLDFPENHADPEPPGAEDRAESWSMQSVEGYIDRCVGRLHAGDSIRSGGTANIPPALYEAVQRVLLSHREYCAVGQSPGLLYGFLLHLQGALRRQAKGLPASISGGDTSHTNPQEYAVACQLRDMFTQTMQVTLPEAELDFIAMYLYLAAKWASSGRVGLLAVFHGEGVAQGMAAFVNATYGVPLVRPISYDGSTTMEQLLEQVVQGAKEEDQGSGVLLLSDMAPLTDLHNHITAVTQLRVETVSAVSLPLLLDLAGKALRGNFSLQALAEAGAQSAAANQVAEKPELGSSFLERIIDEILTTSLTFLSPRKAAETLLLVLDRILRNLGLSYSDEIAIKFIFHCSHMLERVIRGEPLQYAGLKGFINRNGSLLLLLEQQLSYVGEVFGITIPACELAYIVEIFLPFTEKTVSPGGAL